MRKESVLLGLLLVGCLPTNIPTQKNNTNNQAKENQSKNEEVKPQESNSPETKNEIVSEEKPNKETEQNTLETQKESSSSTPIPRKTPIPLPSYSSGPLIADKEECIKDPTHPIPTPRPSPSYDPRFLRSPGRPSPKYYNKPIPDELDYNPETSSDTLLYFKDESKIRWDQEKKSFFSLNCADVSNINNITSKYNLKIYPYKKYFPENEIKNAKDEIESEEFFRTDMPNDGSIYNIYNIGKDYKKIIEEIRDDINVRMCNISNAFGTTS